MRGGLIVNPSPPHTGTGHTAEPDCDCCAGTERVVPRSVANPPGREALAYRVGTFDSFLATMKAQLTGLESITGATNPLDKLRTRATDDPAVAFLDAWAMVADVLTFYQERIANEGYLPTALERRSLSE